MAISYIAGLETGDAGELNALGSGASIVTTPVRSGAYAIKQAASRSPLTIAFGVVSQSVIRTYFQFSAIPGSDVNILAELVSGPTNRLLVIMDSTGAIGVIDSAATLGLTRTIGTFGVLTTNQWYRIEAAIDLAASGVVKVWIDGTLSVNTTHTNNVAATGTVGWAVYGGGSGNWYHDDMRIDTATLTPPGDGRVIARQPITGGTPSGGDAWTKSSGTDAGALWDNTPFDVTDFLSTATASISQCAVLASFATTQTGHGTDTLGASDTINASKLACVGKTSSATSDGADSIRRRVGGVNSDVGITAFTTSNLYRNISPITGITYANLTGGTTEIGIVKTAVGSRTHTVEDVWWIIDYTPAVATALVADSLIELLVTSGPTLTQTQQLVIDSLVELLVLSSPLLTQTHRLAVDTLTELLSILTQTTAWFSGFEIGDGSELPSLGAGNSVQGVTFRSGAYALKVSAAAAQLVTSLSATRSVFRCYFQSPTQSNIAFIKELAAPTTNRMLVTLKGNGTLQVSDAGSTLGLTTLAGSTVLSVNTWYRVEVAVDLAAGGAIKVWINGALEITTTHTNDVSATVTTGYRVQGVANPNEYYFDDCRIDVGGIAPIGPGQCIARQGKAGTPFYNSWTKNGAATAALCWSDTPFSAATNCSDNVLSDAQTMLVAPFSATQAGHGVESIGVNDVVNACRVAMIAKSAVAGNTSIRRRVGGVDTDAVRALTTSDNYCEGDVFIDTITNLDGYEIGVRNTLVATLETVEDMWLLVDYTSGPTALVVASLAELLVITGPSLTQTQRLVADSLIELLVLSSPSLTQTQRLVVSSLVELLVTSGPTLTQTHRIVVDGLTELLVLSGVTLTIGAVSTALIVDSLIEILTLSSPSLTQTQRLALDSLTELLVLSSPSLTQTQRLAADNLAELLVLSSPAVTQRHVLSVTSMTELLVLSSPAITQVQRLIAASLTELITIGLPVVTQLHALNGDSMTIVLSLSSPTLRQTQRLAIDSLVELLFLSGIGAAGSNALVIDGLVIILSETTAALAQTHKLTATSLTELLVMSGAVPTQRHSLATDSLVELLTIGNASMNQILRLIVASLAEVVTISGPTFTQTHKLAPSALVELIAIGPPALSQAHVLLASSMAELITLPPSTLRQRHALSAAGLTIVLDLSEAEGFPAMNMHPAHGRIILTGVEISIAVETQTRTVVGGNSDDDSTIFSGVRSRRI